MSSSLHMDMIFKINLGLVWHKFDQVIVKLDYIGKIPKGKIRNLMSSKLVMY
jgi:hypothetical protein